jgi:hypothetical protein
MRTGMLPEQLCEKQLAYAARRQVIRDAIIAGYLKAWASDREREDPE